MINLRKMSLLTAISVLLASGNCIADTHPDECCPLKKSAAEDIGEAAGEAAANVEQAVDDLSKGAQKGYEKAK